MATTVRAARARAPARALARGRTAAPAKALRLWVFRLRMVVLMVCERLREGRLGGSGA